MKSEVKKIVGAKVTPDVLRRFKICLAQEGVPAQVVLEEAVMKFITRVERDNPVIPHRRGR